MKGRLVAFAGIFCIACLIVSGAYADKPGKPDKPGGTNAECIVFTEDLVGREEVEGCCPNAGPWPAYTMTLDMLDDAPYEGQLFINFFGTGPNQQYTVQFWTWDYDTETSGDDDYFFEVYGGDIVKDKKNKTLTVTFTDETATLWVYDDENDPIELDYPVSFKLLRTSDLSYCE